MTLRGILFDKDGTLIDFEASWSRVYRELALDLARGDAVRAETMMIAGGLDQATGRIRGGTVLASGTTIDIATLWFPELDGDAFLALVGDIDAVFHRNGIAFSVPMPGLAATLERLSAMGFVMGVATSDGTAATKAALEMLGVAPLLPHVFGYDSVPRPKPAPDMLYAFAAATGLAPSEILVIGDNHHDLAMARAAGAGAAIGVLSGTGEESDLAPLADAILPDLNALPGWLAHQNRK
jgi:phosphoglycolate phosphatase